MDRARAAHRHPASELCAGKIQDFSDYPEQRHIARDVNSPRLTIYSYSIGHDPRVPRILLIVSVYLAQVELNCK